MPGVLVIGSSAGLGTSVARRFGVEGLPVSVVARSAAALGSARTELHASGICDVITHAADVADPVQLRRAIDAVCRSRGTPEVLVYDVCHRRTDKIGELDHEGHLHAFAVNVVGALHSANLVAPRMARSGYGTIIFSGGPPVPVLEQVSLSLGKAALRALALLLDLEYRSQGVHVASVTAARRNVHCEPFDPDLIAEQYWRVHIQPPAEWETEVLLTSEIQRVPLPRSFPPPFAVNGVRAKEATRRHLPHPHP